MSQWYCGSGKQFIGGGGPSFEEDTTFLVEIVHFGPEEEDIFHDPGLTLTGRDAVAEIRRLFEERPELAETNYAWIIYSDDLTAEEVHASAGLAYQEAILAKREGML
jgi:hypothetical protein